MSKKLLNYSSLFTFIAVLLCSSFNLNAQSPGLGSWNQINVQYTFNKKILLFGETQIRSINFYDHYFYFDAKGGVNYSFDNGLKLALAAGKYNEFQEGGDFLTPMKSDEIRLWAQLISTENLWKVKVEQRYRAELRYFPYETRHRFRYRLGLSYPFGPKINGARPLTVSVSNEVFMMFETPYFIRNRFSPVLKYRFSKNLSAQAGYLYQFDYKYDAEKGRDFLFIGLIFDFYHKDKPTAELTNLDLTDL
jgi:hypothetical protein